MYKLKAEIEKKEDGTFTAIASTEAEDRQGEKVSVDGWDLTNFKNNPILLFMHDHTKPIGKATRVWIERASGKPKLMFKGVISTATDIGRGAKQLMEEGVLNSFSVGFRALEMNGNVISKSELYEISLVSVPANPEARMVALKSLEGFDKTVVDELIGEQDQSVEALKNKVAELEAEIVDIKETVQAVKGLQHPASQKGSKQEIATERLRMSRVIAKAADKLITDTVSRDKAVSYAKIIKRSSEILIRSNKGDL